MKRCFGTAHLLTLLLKRLSNGWARVDHHVSKGSKSDRRHSPTPGRRRFPTIADVAARAGVSTSTVSYVMNNRNRVSQETRRRVLKAIEELGYQPNNAAQGLATRQMSSIGILLPLSPEAVFADPFFPELLRGIGRATQRHGYTMVLSMVEETGLYRAGAQLLRSQRADGILVIDPRRAHTQIPRLVEEGYPVVVIGRQEYPGVLWADVDNWRGGYEAARHLVTSCPEGDVAVICGPRQHRSAEDRLAGYRAALAEAGIPWNQVQVVYGDFSERSGYEGMRELLRRGRPRRVLVANDLMAIGAYQAIGESGLSIPGDVALVGFDDIAFGRHLIPPLTTVRQPTALLGETAGEMLASCLRSETTPEPVTLPVELVVRESSGAARG